MRERLSVLGDVKLEVVDVEIEGSRALIELIARGEGAASGAPTAMTQFFVQDHADDGRVSYWREFHDRASAEAAFACEPPVRAEESGS